MEVMAEVLTKFREHLMVWFRENGREFPWRENDYPEYMMIVTEALLQRTRAETVASFLPAFFSRFPSWEALAEASVDDIGEAIRPVGLWRQRAPRLKALAEEMMRRGGIVPRSREDLEALPIVGQYIANAILLMSHGEPQPLLDVNMARVLERYFGPRKLADIRYDPYLQGLARAVVNAPDSQYVNWAILDFAALVCKARTPRCQVCPLASGCQFRHQADSARETAALRP